MAFNGLLHWALGLPRTTRVELLHILANLPPPGFLVLKQLVRYERTLRPAPDCLQPMPGRPRQATAVWDAIAAAEAVAERPLLVAPHYWSRVLEEYGADVQVPTLYAAARQLLSAGLETSESLRCLGTLSTWCSMLPHLFAAADAYVALPPAWCLTSVDLAGTALTIEDTYRPQPHATPRCMLRRHKAPNWLAASARHLAALLDLLATTSLELRFPGSCVCGAAVPTGHELEHLLVSCPHTVDLPDPWLALCRHHGVGFAFVAASTRMVPTALEWCSVIRHSPGDDPSQRPIGGTPVDDRT